MKFFLVSCFLCFVFVIAVVWVLLFLVLFFLLVEVFPFSAELKQNELQ